MRHCRIDHEVLKSRRTEIAKSMGTGALVLAAHPEMVRNNDVHHDYRQDSSFYYYTGFEEPESVMVFRPGCNPEYVIFCRKKDPERETWDGFRFGPEGAQSEFMADEAYEISELEQRLPEMLLEVDKVYYSFLHNPEFQRRMHPIFEVMQKKKGRGASSIPPVIDPSGIIGEQRLIKRDYEIETMKKACQISAQAHIAAMKFVRPGANERQVHGVLKYMMMMDGAAREGYGSIVASGDSATTLHYTFNDQACEDGDLLLIDSGAEYEYYTGDITRTFPVNGRFTEPQKAVYQTVLDAQKAVLEICKPGTPFTDLQKTTIRLLTQGMVELGLLKGSVDELIEEGAFRSYYMHGVSHWLGMDVHDIGTTMVDKEPRALRPGMMFTVEPGLYIPEADETAPAEFRGIGVRIEDNILITENGHENMTSACPKEIAELEAILGNGPEV